MTTVCVHNVVQTCEHSVLIIVCAENPNLSPWRVLRNKIPSLITLRCDFLHNFSQLDKRSKIFNAHQGKFGSQWLNGNRTFRQRRFCKKISRRFRNFSKPKRPVFSWFCFWFPTNWLGPVCAIPVCRVLEFCRKTIRPLM